MRPGDLKLNFELMRVGQVNREDISSTVPHEGLVVNDIDCIDVTTT